MRKKRQEISGAPGEGDAPLRFSGNNYLGLASSLILKDAAAAALSRYGVSVAASRLSTGTEEIHNRLEKALAEFMGREAALTFASGYLSDLVFFQALAPRYEDVFLDASAHSSLRDAVPRGKQLYEYANLDVDDLERLLRKHDRGRSLIATDGIFPLTGDIAPLDRIGEVAKKFGAMLVSDDAHAVGVLGANGRGTLELFDMENEPNAFQTGTFSKAFGGYGGFIAASNDIMDAIRDKARAFAGSTALPPPLAAADLAALEWLKTKPESRKSLLALSEKAHAELRRMGFQTGGDGTPIAPLYFDSKREAEALSEFLRQRKIQVPYFDYPVKTGRYILRLTFSLSHADAQVAYLFETLKAWRDQS